MRLVEQENELLIAYRETVAEPTVQVNGKEVRFSDVIYDVRDQQEYNALCTPIMESTTPFWASSIYG